MPIIRSRDSKVEGIAKEIERFINYNYGFYKFGGL